MTTPQTAEAKSSTPFWPEDLKSWVEMVGVTGYS